MEANLTRWRGFRFLIKNDIKEDAAIKGNVVHFYLAEIHVRKITLIEIGLIESRCRKIDVFERRKLKAAAPIKCAVDTRF